MADSYVVHMTNVMTRMSHALLSQPPHQGARPYIPAPLLMISAYLVVLLVMVVLGLCMGWQRQGGGGHGGGGGNRRPRAHEPTPPGGAQRTIESPDIAHAADFAAWERQFQAAGAQHAPDGEPASPAGTP